MIQPTSTTIFPLKVCTSRKPKMEPWNMDCWKTLSFPFGMAQPGRCYGTVSFRECISPPAIPGIPNAPHKLGKRNVHHSFHAKTSRANAPEGRLETSWVSSTFSEVLLPYISIRGYVVTLPQQCFVEMLPTGFRTNVLGLNIAIFKAQSCP